MAFLENQSLADDPVVFLLGGNPAALGEDRALIFDAVISESTTFSSMISKHPISTGSVITDNVISNNISFKFRAIVSDHPHQEYVNNIITKEGAVPGSGIYGDLRKFRTNAAYRTLVAIDKSKEPFTIVTSHATYPNCVIQSMTLNVGTVAMLDISLSIEKLRIVSTETAIGQPVVVQKKVERDSSPPKLKGTAKPFFDQSPAVEETVNNLLNALGTGQGA